MTESVCHQPQIKVLGFRHWPGPSTSFIRNFLVSFWRESILDIPRPQILPMVSGMRFERFAKSPDSTCQKTMAHAGDKSDMAHLGQRLG